MSCPKCVIRNQRMTKGNETCHVPQTTLDDPYQKMMAERAKQDTMWSTAAAPPQKAPTAAAQTKRQ